MTVRPYGSWPSALDAHAVARSGGLRFANLSVAGTRVRWSESRAAEGGRVAVVDSELGDLTPPGSNARTRVHEYGGGAVWYHGDTVFYSEFADSRIYRVDGGEARPITAEPPSPHAWRYADGVVTPDGSTIVCVRERHGEGEAMNELVSLPADGSAEPEIVAGGHDFFQSPRFDAAGKRLAWIAWDHPNMPWDGTYVYRDGEVVAGGPNESAIDPKWSPDGALHWLSDRTGWWNVYREGSPLTSLSDAEIGGPAWAFGMSWYAFLDDARMVCVVARDAVDSLQLLANGELDDLGLGWTSYSPTALASGDGRVAYAAASPTEVSTLVLLDVSSGHEETVRRSLDVELDRDSISVPVAIEFPTRDGAIAHAFYYPPRNAEFEGSADEAPPLRVTCHGGPTANVTPHLDLETQYFTQRGIGVVDVNYRGSTGYGTAYRRALNGRWGEIDWQDCLSAAQFLAREGDADAAKTWVEGGSAGGYVVLCSLAFDPEAYAAGVSLFGVADAEALATDTHKFESRYLDSMIGPYPEDADVYRARSPIHFFDRLERPLLILQGLDDKVVPPSQAEMMVEALQRKGVPYAYLAFEGEGHGFRREENIVRSLEAILSFVGQVFGFEPAGEIEPVAIA
ncbi:MAG TPA: prolyl oligopeptidase family serine peptidase [Gaiellaceae bacterium]|nr:prolyl oligopeptidase family serine peptidase [Gaiellaceae bacterium]